MKIIHLIKISLLFIFLIFFTGDILAQTHFARANGDWDDTNVWSTTGTGGVTCGCVPGVGANVLIDGYDVDVDAANVTVAYIEITSLRGADVRLRVQNSRTLTVTTDFEMENDAVGRFAELIVEDNGSIFNVNGSFLMDVDDGDDVVIDIDDTGQINVTGDVAMDQDGADEILIRLNNNSGTAAQFNVTGNFTFDKNGGDDLTILVDDASSLLSVGGDFSVDVNNGLGNGMVFNLDGGNLTVTGDLNLTRSNDGDRIDFDMDGGNLTAGDIIINSGGTLSGSRAVRFYIDENSIVTANSIDVTMTGGDDFYFRLNDGAGTTAQANIAGNFSIVRSGGDDIHIYVDDDGSRLNIGGDFTINSTGGEQTLIYIDNDAQLNVAGNFSYTHTQGQNMEIDLAGGTDNPLFDVNGSATISLLGGGDDIYLDFNSGTFDVAGNCTISQISGSTSEEIFVDLDDDAIMNVGGNLTAVMTGGNDLEIHLGNNFAGSTAQLNVTGNYTLDHNGGSSVGDDIQFLVLENSICTVGGDFTMDTDGSGSSGNFYSDIRNNGRMTVTGNIQMISTIGGGYLELELSNNALLQIGGSFIRGASPSKFGVLDCQAGTTVEYNGSGVQIFAQDAGDGGDSFNYENVIINNIFGTSPQITMEGLATINDDITFTDGIISSTVTNILVIANNATSTGPSNASFVDGYVRKIGNDAFVFPVGDATYCATAAISAPGSTTDAFDARFLYSEPHSAGYDSTLKDPTINHISHKEYWMVNRTAGTSNVNVTLSWDTPRSGGVTNMAEMLVAHWDGAIWKDHGNGGTTGIPATGTVTSSGVVTSFGPFTLASTSFANPLPVELLNFEANINGDKVDLKWVTTTEINNDYFTVERSVDAKTWEEVVVTSGAGNSSQTIAYFETDYEPLNDISYYRLKQTDFNGQYSYSIIVPVKFVKGNSDDISLFPSPISGGETLNIEFNNIFESEILVVLRDIRGREFYSKVFVNIEDGKLIGVPLERDIPAGIYLVTASSENQIYSKKLIIKSGYNYLSKD